MFKHNFLPKVELVATSTEEGRVYLTPEGNKYRSVTTIIGEASDKSGLHAWRKRVGEKEASKIAGLAASRGTAVHKICEKYLLNEEDYAKDAMPTTISMFKNIKKILDTCVGDVYGIEFPLYSDTLKTAGRSDFLTSFVGIDSVVDFKTSTRLKKKSFILNYFLQSACYALMTEERTGLKIPQIAIIIACEENDTPQVFIEKTDTYRDRVIKLFMDAQKKK